VFVRTYPFNNKPTMEFLDSLGSILANINYELIFQLVCLALIVLSGPVVIFLLAVRGGDL